MSRAQHLSATALVLLVAVPLPWLACGGGESKPPESPASESSAAASAQEPPASDTPAPAASASSASAADKGGSKSASPDETATAAPPPPSFGSTDCGQCVDKTCAKPVADCGKNSDCVGTLDAIHSCSSGAAACIDGASLPATAKPKKLAKAYEACAKKAVTSKACKAKCQ